jgi:hypothetical protein
VIEVGYQGDPNQISQHVDDVSKATAGVFTVGVDQAKNVCAGPASNGQPQPQPQPQPNPQPAPVQFTIVKTQFEKPNNNPTTTDKALKKAKTGSKIMEVAYFLLSSGPSSVTVDSTFTLKRGSHTVSQGTASGTVVPDPINPGYATYEFTVPKKAGSYRGTITITAGGQTESGSAAFKVVKK